MNKEKKTIKNYATDTSLKTIGMTYDEYEQLDFDEQQRIIAEYHKKNPVKSKTTTVMIGGGDESIFIEVPKGEEILTPNGYYIAGETLEENKKRWEEREKKVTRRFEELNKNFDKEYQKSLRLDFKTWLFLYITRAIRVEHDPVVEVKEKRIMHVKDNKPNEVYVFKNYDEYRNFFLMYLNDVNDDLINLAIYAKGSKGQIVALKELCERIIVKKKVNDFYNSITQEQIDEIHRKGKITPLEAVQLWESFDLCIEGNKTISCENRCDYFNYNCHECLMETASHKLEHDKIDLKLTNSINDEKVPVKKLTPYKN